jgi:undecaprenyl-diphosphatase
VSLSSTSREAGGLIVADLRAFARRWKRQARALTPPFPAFGAVMAVLACGFAIRFALEFDARASLGAKALSPALVNFFRAITDFGTSGWMWALALAVAGAASWARWKDGTRRDLALAALGERAMFLMATLAVSGLLPQAIKLFVGRGRPKFLETEGPFVFKAFSFNASYASFPSGHATTMFAMAAALGFLAPRWRAPLFLLAAIIALSRVIVRAHYPADVIAGACLGAASAYLVARAFARRDIALRFVGRYIVPRAPGLIRAELPSRKKRDS